MANYSIGRRTFCAVTTAALLTATGVRAQGATKDPIVLRLGHTNSLTHPKNLAAVRFAELVEKKTNDAIEVKVFANSQLATEPQLVPALQTGAADFSICTIAWAQSLFPDTAVVDLPFVFKDSASAARTLDGPIGQQLFEPMPAKGVVGLSWMSAGWRQMENNVHRITAPSDMRGLKMRIQNSPLFVAMFKALNAIPVVLSFDEAYTALAQHTVDGIDVPYVAVVEEKIQEVVKYVSETNHNYNAAPLLASKTKMDSLTPDQRTAIFESAHEATVYLRSIYAERDAGYKAALIKKGLEITTQVDHAAFVAAMAPLYEQARSTVRPGLVDAVLKANAT